MNLNINAQIDDLRKRVEAKAMELGLTSQQMADEMELTSITLRKFLFGQEVIRTTTILKLKRWLGDYK